MRQIEFLGPAGIAARLLSSCRGKMPFLKFRFSESAQPPPQPPHHRLFDRPSQSPVERKHVPIDALVQDRELAEHWIADKLQREASHQFAVLILFSLFA